MSISNYLITYFISSYSYIGKLPLYDNYYLIYKCDCPVNLMCSSETKNDIPIWMEFSIFRSDLAHPITVREYFSELKTEHPMWVQMPRRMLRHKTVQQCVRLAFGISISEYQLMENQPNKVNANIFPNKKSSINPKAILKEKYLSALKNQSVIKLLSNGDQARINQSASQA